MFSKIFTNVISQSARRARTELPVIRGASYAGNRHSISYWVDRVKPNGDIFTPRRSPKINFRHTDSGFDGWSDIHSDTYSFSSNQSTPSRKLRKRQPLRKKQTKLEAMVQELKDELKDDIRREQINSRVEQLMSETPNLPTRYYAARNWAQEVAENEFTRRNSLPVKPTKPLTPSPIQARGRASTFPGTSTPINTVNWTHSAPTPAPKISMPTPYHLRYGHNRSFTPRIYTPTTSGYWSLPATPSTPKVTMPTPYHLRYGQDQAFTPKSSTPITNTPTASSPSSSQTYIAYHPDPSVRNARSEGNLKSVRADKTSSRRLRKLQKAQDDLEKRLSSRLSMSFSDDSSLSLSSTSVTSSGYNTPTRSYGMGEPLSQSPKKSKRSSFSSAIETIMEPVELDSKPIPKKSWSWPGSPVTPTSSETMGRKNIFATQRNSIWSESSADSSNDILNSYVQQRRPRKSKLRKKTAEMIPVSDKENPLATF